MTTGRINQVAFLNDVAAARGARRAPVPRSEEQGNRSTIVSSRRQLQSYKTRKKGQIGARGPVPSRWTESENSGNRSQAKAVSLRDDRGTLFDAFASAPHPTHACC